MLRKVYRSTRNIKPKVGVPMPMKKVKAAPKRKMGKIKK